jgi:hypothetical protein
MHTPYQLLGGKTVKKTLVSLLLVLSLVALIALASSSRFTGSTTSGLQEIKSGSLALSLKAEDAPEIGISGLISGDKSWIPGDHREALLTIKNEGSLDARWRLGIVPSGEQDESLLDEIIISFYSRDESGNWKLIKSERMKNLLVQADNEQWLYDKDIFLTGTFNPLKPGQAQQLVMQVDFELSAMSPLQGKDFKGNLVLQGAQVTSNEWFPTSKTPISIKGAEK